MNALKPRNLLVISGLMLISFCAISQEDITPKDDESYKACADKDQGDVCSYLNKAGTDINGKCRFPQMDGEGKLQCEPST